VASRSRRRPWLNLPAISVPTPHVRLRRGELAGTRRGRSRCSLPAYVRPARSATAARRSQTRRDNGIACSTHAHLCPPGPQSPRHQWRTALPTCLTPHHLVGEAHHLDPCTVADLVSARSRRDTAVRRSFPSSLSPLPPAPGVRIWPIRCRRGCDVRSRPRAGSRMRIPPPLWRCVVAPDRYTDARCT
jgi:hypothetical protein